MGDSEWSRPTGFKLPRENLQSRVKEEDSITNVENAFEGPSLHVSRPSRLCAQARSRDDMPFRKQACTEYTRWVFYKMFRRPRERHLSCPTRMHGSRPLSFQGYVLNHGLIPSPDHLFGDDTGTAPIANSLASHMSTKGKMGGMFDMQVTLHDKRIVMQDTLHYEAIVMQVTLHDKRIVMQVTLHYDAIVMQVTLHDKRIVMKVMLHYEATVMQVALHDKRIIMQVMLHYEAIVMQVTLHDKRIVMQVTLHDKRIV
nr:hypothetical protein [Tanacetum cinerariifolium]